jgi:hypothetical protein
MRTVPTNARKLSFNADNWTGKTVNLTVEEGNTFSLNGYTFSLVDTTADQEHYGDKPGDRFYFRCLELHAEGWKHRLTVIGWFDGDNDSDGFETMGEGANRSHPTDPVVAAARWILMNV